MNINSKWLTSPLPPHPTSPIIVGRGQIFSEIQTIYLPWRAVKLICCNSVYYTAAIICFHFQVRGEVSGGQTGSGLLGQSASTLRWPTRKLEAAPFIIPCHTPSHLLYCKLHTNCQLLHQLYFAFDYRKILEMFYLFNQRKWACLTMVKIENVFKASLPPLLPCVAWWAADGRNLTTERSWSPNQINSMN